ncbi:MAG: hypothetical protein JRH19_06000, partial [Deltaproteobacteria bacterium]|nr:hypothetical protein [Deltaproteobacteria bacterium]
MTATGSANPLRLSPIFFAIVFASFFVCALAIYWPSLPGLFYSDDAQYIAHNEYIHRFTPENLRAILD